MPATVITKGRLSNNTGMQSAFYGHAACLGRGDGEGWDSGGEGGRASEGERARELSRTAWGVLRELQLKAVRFPR